jgi:hypothetical protein
MSSLKNRVLGTPGASLAQVLEIHRRLPALLVWPILASLSVDCHPARAIGVALWTARSRTRMRFGV